MFLILPWEVFAQTFPFEVTYPRLGPVTLPSPQVVVEDPGYYIRYLYQAGVIAGVVLALFSLAFGGFLFLFSAGNVSRQIESKDRIAGAFVGLFLLLSSFLILRTINPEFTRFQFRRPPYPFTEIEEGVWLCQKEIKETYQMNNIEHTLTFEAYIESRRSIREYWWPSLEIEEQKAIHNLYYNVHSNCHLISISQELPENFRRARHVYIVGNYGIVFHRFPNFKGPYKLVALERKMYLDLDKNINQIESGPRPLSYFVLRNEEIPNFSVTLFKDFRLDYLDSFAVDKRLLPFQEYRGEFPRQGTITFYTFRNFHEDLPSKFQKPESTCPSFRDHQGFPRETQKCFKTYEFKIENFFVTFNQQPFTVKIGNDSFIENFWVGTVSLHYIGTIDGGKITNGVELDSCYSLKIDTPGKYYEGKSWWIVIVRGYPREDSSSLPLPPVDLNIDLRIWAMQQPHFWGEAFDKSDRNLEDNYVSFFCEDKARQKRYPCVHTAIVFPGRIIKEVER